MENQQKTHDEASLLKQLALLKEEKAELVVRVKELSVRDRENKNLIRTLFDKLPYGVMMLDENRNIAQINQMAANLFAQDRRNLIGKNCSELIHCYTQNNGCPVLDFAQSLNQVRTHCQVTNKSLLRSAVVNESANGRFIVESFGDITELDQAVIEKTLALQTKSNFLSNISHELRTPMHGIMGFTDLLAERSEEMGGSSKSYITELKHSANRLWGLLEKLFQAASLEENTVQLHTTLFDFSIFIEDLRKEVALTLDKGTNHFELNYDSTIGKIGCDVLKLHQILIGLLENAFKYTKNGEVELVATIDKKQDARFLRVCVKDTGIGISENKQYEIFNLFEQEDGSVNRPYQGAGLGLAISRQLAILMGGDITVKSVQGKGSEFILSLPV